MGSVLAITVCHGWMYLSHLFLADHAQSLSSFGEAFCISAVVDPDVSVGVALIDGIGSGKCGTSPCLSGCVVSLSHVDASGQCVCEKWNIFEADREIWRGEVNVLIPR